MTLIAEESDIETQRAPSIAYALALVEHAIAVHRERDKPVTKVRFPPQPQELPLAFCMEFQAIIVYLFRLESAGILNSVERHLADVAEALKDLRHRLIVAPDEFWEECSTKEDFALRVWRIYREYDWLNWNDLPIATSGALDEQEFELLAEFLWNFRHLDIELLMEARASVADGDDVNAAIERMMASHTTSE